MKHCIEFEPMDVWFLKNNEKFYDRKLSFGICPMCNKPIAILVQYDIIQDKYVSIKKIGISADEFVQSFKNQIMSSVSKLNRQKFKPNVCGWVYGHNVQRKNDIKQYAKDFYGNKVLIRVNSLTPHSNPIERR